MDWPENLLILLGISLDIFAGMECKGSLLAKIENTPLCRQSRKTELYNRSRGSAR